MRKNVIYAVNGLSPRKLHFYYRDESTSTYLFSIPNRKCIYYFFRNGKSLPELRRQKNWHNNYILSHVIEGHVEQAFNKLQKGVNAYE